MTGLIRTLCLCGLFAVVAAGCERQSSSSSGPLPEAVGGAWQNSGNKALAGRQAPAIRIYMTGMEEFGEVAGITASSEETVELTLRLEDTRGEALTRQPMEISSLVGNGLSAEALITDAQGLVSLRVQPVLPGEDILTFTGAGISKQLSVYITDQAYGQPMQPLHVRALELPEIDGVVPWSTMTGIETREGIHGLLLPVFSDKVLALDGREVRLQGFMLPLENSEKQSHFMLTSTSPSCFFCLPGGPESMVEVKTSKPVDFSFDPVVIAGTMELLEDSDMGLFYRLNGAQAVTPN